MCDDQYDEDLHKNLFFKELLVNHCDLIKKACEKYWIICVPRNGTIESNELTINVILDHILIENFDENHSIYSTLNKQQLIVDNKTIKQSNKNEKEAKSTRILFEETFYLDKTTSKYIVWCIESPLFIDRNEYKTPLILETLQDCYDYLWNINLGCMIEKLQELCELFVEKHQQFPYKSLQTQKELLGNLYSQCLQIMLKNTKFINNDVHIEKIKLAVESLMQHYLNIFLIKSINTLTTWEDNNFNKIIRNSNGLQMSDLNISNKYYDNIINAKYELNKINNYYTILDKINCIKLMYKQLELIETTNELLQILIFIIIKLNINNWISNLFYLTKYQFTNRSFNNKTNFLLTNLEAAIEFIKSQQFLELKQKNFEKNSTNLPTFQKLHHCDLTTFEELLLNDNNDNNIVNLCHPLCVCNDCGNLPKKSKLLNEKGQNLLIYSTIINRFDFVKYLISHRQELKLDINSRDYYGRTALHYACYYGYQNLVLLLLLLSIDNININSSDNDGNTALHLAVNNCHENCIKALLFTTKNLNINAINKNGDTPLHLAIKWCYYQIIYLLLENKINPYRLNKRNQLAINMNCNYLIDDLYRKFQLKFTQNQLLQYTIVNNNNNLGVKPRNLDELKRIKLLLKTIKNNDLPLTRYYLGYPEIAQIDDDFRKKCHPLCNCNSCNNDQILIKNNKSIIPKTSIINVNLCNKHGYTALHIAARYGRLEIVRLLLDLNVSINLKTYKHLYSPLHLACIYQQISIVKELIQCGDCLIDCQDYRGNTPLYYACINNNLIIVELLLSNGADCKIQNYRGVTILNKVENRCLYGVQKLLKKWYIDSDSDYELF